MLYIINALLDLWDPYGLYLFPKDEYTSYAIEIQAYVEEHKKVDEEMLTNFVYQILPPIHDILPPIAKHDEIIVKIDYRRFAKALLLLL